MRYIELLFTIIRLGCNLTSFNCPKFHLVQVWLLRLGQDRCRGMVASETQMADPFPILYDVTANNLMVGNGLGKVLLEERQESIGATDTVLGAAAGLCDGGSFGSGRLCSVVCCKFGSKVRGKCRYGGFRWGAELLHCSDMCILRSGHGLVGFYFAEVEVLDEVLA